VTEKPILFSGEMVRAILDGRKTQTRRVVKPQPWMDANYQPGQPMWTHESLCGFFAEHVFGACMAKLAKCPFGEPGTRLWVRETWARTWGADDAPLGTVIYRADIPDWAEERNVRRIAKRLAAENPWKPSIHMPRWASRITLEVTDVRAERLQEISEEDAKAEGVELDSDPDDWRDYETCGSAETARDSFRSLWDTINTKRGFDWASNPWCWVVSFKRVEAKREAT
jgi:hypothetical protein